MLTLVAKVKKRRKHATMLFTTILNRVLKFKSFVFKNAKFGKMRKGQPTIEVEVVSRKGSKAICSGCEKPRPGYDTLPARYFEHIPFWGFLIFLVYRRRRVDFPQCGVVVEKIPWANGKEHITESYQWFLAHWARLLSWQEVARCFKTSWHQVFTAVKMAVTWGRERMNLENIFSIGIDEVLWHRGHKYLTVVYQIDNHCKRLLWIGKDRHKKTLLRFFRWLGKERWQVLKFICSDLWKPYIGVIEVIKKAAPHLLHIVDRFHIMAQMNRAIDNVRAEEVKNLKRQGNEPILRKTRWIFLKRPENLTESQDQTLAQLLKQNLKTVRSYLLKEDFQRLWEYISPYWAGRFIDRWTRKVMYSRIKPMKKIAKMIRRHKPLIMNWFKAKKNISSGIVEGLNGKVKLTFKKAFGFRTFEATEIQLYHTLGDLPLPKFTHKFF
jgi:transposase